MGKARERRYVNGPQAADRTCLVCGRTFRSEGPWNRRCPACDRAVARLGTAALAGRHVSRGNSEGMKGDTQ